MVVSGQRIFRQLSAVSAGERRCRNTYGRPDSRKLCPERARYFSGRAEEHPAFPDFSSVCSQSESRRCCYYRSQILQRYRQCALRIQDPPHAGRNRIPSIEEVKTIKELKPYLKDYNLVAYEETAKQHEHGELFHTLQQLKAGDQLLIIVGCEGGFDESEIQELNEMGVKCCSLGNRILRSETAPLYLMSVIGYSRELTK